MRKCPPEFQDRITRRFGTNEFGDPHFKVMWTQSQFIRMGNIWRDKFGNERTGYIERYQCPTPCWGIFRWKTPKEYGSPDVYYANTFDKVSGMYITGEYPWRGRYEILQPLYRKELVDGNLVVEHFPLSHILIDAVIPLMVQAKHLSEEERTAATMAARKAEEDALTNEIAERMANDLPVWYGPVSYSRQGCKTSLLDRKMQAIQKQWDRLSKNGTRPNFQKGLSQGPAPRLIN